MKNKILIFTTVIALFHSCKEESDSFRMPNSAMENTISMGAQVKYEGGRSIGKDEIVAFRLPRSNEITCERIVGFPGDTIEIKKGKMYINSKEYELKESSKNIYTVFSKNPQAFSGLQSYEYKPYSKNYGMVRITKKEYEEIVRKKIVDSIYELGFDSLYEYPGIVKTSTSKGLNHYYYGPVIIPKIGDALKPEDQMLVKYFYKLQSGDFVVKDDLYFCIGDSFADAMDSRIFGLVPKKEILGIVTQFENVRIIDVPSK